jgi:phage tail sheath protein FI
MPEYLAPGVYVEEVSYRAKTLEGVSTTTTGFIGPTRYGPFDMEPDIITSLGEYERVYGDRQKLQFGIAEPMDNFMWHAVRAFFQEGGKRLYISRAFRPLAGSDGYARVTIPKVNVGNPGLTIRARFPGVAGSIRVRLTLRLGQNVLGGEPARDAQGRLDPHTLKPTVAGLSQGDVVWISNLPSPPGSPPASEQGDFYIADSVFDAAKKVWTWRFITTSTTPVITPTSGSIPTTLQLDDLAPNADARLSDKVRIVTLTITAISPDGTTQVWDGLPLDPKHEKGGTPDSPFVTFGPEPGSLSQALRLPFVLSADAGIADGLDVLSALLSESSQLHGALDRGDSTNEERSIDAILSGGNDGERPTATEYEGSDDPAKSKKTGLKSFEDIEDISIVAAPGSTFGYEQDAAYRAQAQTIASLLIAHAEKMRYRIAVIDSGNKQAISDVRAMRARYDSKYAAFYYPWVRVLDPVTQREIHLPPSGFVAGIYARNDIVRAVYKAPANEVVNLAIGFETLLNKSQQDVLNPEGINCFRFFEGRGFRLWGARTMTSDPEWKYVNLRRYFAYLERSVDKGTQWAVFEPNGEALWANIRRTIEDFLFNEWVMGALLGDKPERAFFVRCDRSTMTQNDLDNGRLVCLIGVAPLRPAEFVIFRIGQWTADRKS